MDSYDPIMYIGNVIGNVTENACTEIIHCFWTNDTNCNSLYGNNHSEVLVKNSYGIESNNKMINILNEYSEKNINWDK